MGILGRLLYAISAGAEALKTGTKQDVILAKKCSASIS